MEYASNIFDRCALTVNPPSSQKHALESMRWTVSPLRGMDIPSAESIGGVHWVCAMRVLAKPEISMNVLNNADPIATIEQFKAALLATRDWNGISPMQLRMLQAQCRAPACTISASQMADQLELKSFAAARLQYGTFARAIAEKLGYAPPHKGTGAPCWWFTLSTGRDVVDDASDSRVEWIMRPELVAALNAMKWA